MTMEMCEFGIAYTVKGSEGLCDKKFVNKYATSIKESEKQVTK
jgi:hypothetical protein